MKLIDKDAVIAEIKRKQKEEVSYYENGSFASWADQNHYFTLEDIKSFIDTIEVKEVDFGTEVYKYIDKHFNVYDDGNQTLQTKDKKSLIGRVDVENIAKYFFELGIKIQKEK